MDCFYSINFCVAQLVISHTTGIAHTFEFYFNFSSIHKKTAHCKAIYWIEIIGNKR